jgi:hypothetical protein
VKPGLLVVVATAVTAAPLSPRIAHADWVSWDRLAAAPAQTPAAAKARAAPKRIPARERIADVVPQPFAREKGDPTRTVTVVASAERTKAPPTPGGLGVCLNGHGSKRTLQLQMTGRDATDAVQALHIERLSADADSATLESTDAFLDLRTLGSRAVSRTTTKLSKIADGPSGVRVFAARQADGSVQFLVTGAQAPPAVHGEATGIESFLSTSLADASGAPVDHDQTDCRYVHFTLSVTKGTGQTANILAPAPTPPAQRDPDDESDPRAQANRLARAVNVVVSMSQLPSEGAPLVSVSFGVIP